MLRDALSRLPLPEALRRRGRPPGVRTAKIVLAAVLAFVVASSLHTTDSPVLAPLTALLVVQATAYQTFAHGLQRVASVLAGVLVAVAVSTAVGLTWWSLGGVVAVSLVVGRLLRLGPQLLEVPISAMLVLAVGGAEQVALGRVYETLIGAAAGVLVNAIIAPPLYLQPAGDALSELAQRMAGFLRGHADALRAGWSRAQADRWLERARALGPEVVRADRVLSDAEESARLNPRSGPVRREQPRLRTALTGLEHCYVALRELSRTLLDRTYFVPVEEEATVYGEEVRAALGDVLDAAAGAMEAAATVAAAATPVDDDRALVAERIVRLHERRDALATLLFVDPQSDPAAWSQHGTLLAAVDRLRTELEATVRLPGQPWRPPQLAARPRGAVRRIAGHTRPRRPPRP